jgi:hypothetical protein
MAEMVLGYASNIFCFSGFSFNFKKADLNKRQTYGLLKFCGEKHPYF